MPYFVSGFRQLILYSVIGRIIRGGRRRILIQFGVRKIKLNKVLSFFPQSFIIKIKITTIRITD